MTLPDHHDNPHRVRAAHVEWVAERLSLRDWGIIESVNRLRLVSGNQLERLHFAELAGRSREVTRGRVLRRLVGWRVLIPLERRIGGAMRGSAGLVYALDSTGRQLLIGRGTAGVRRAGVPTERTIRHTLAVAELYVGLVEAARTSNMSVIAFEAEPDSWWPDGLRGHLKPDAYLALELDEVRDHWWAEIDLASESLPTIRRKLLAYLDFLRRGQLGPGGVMPRVLVTTLTEKRRVDIAAIVEKMPEPAARLFVVTLDRKAILQLYASLKE